MGTPEGTNSSNVPWKSFVVGGGTGGGGTNWVSDGNGGITCTNCGAQEVTVTATPDPSGMMMANYGMSTTFGFAQVTGPQPQPKRTYTQFLSCYYNSMVEQFTDQESSGEDSYVGILGSIVAGAAVGKVPAGAGVVSALLLSPVVMADGVQANMECSQ